MPGLSNHLLHAEMHENGWENPDMQEFNSRKSPHDDSRDYK